MELVAAIVGLVLRGPDARPLVVVYVAAVLVTYCRSGADPRARAHAQGDARGDAAYLAQGVLGTAMLAYAVLARGQSRRHGPARAQHLPAAGRPMAVFALGVAVTVLELPTPCPTWAR